LAGVQVARYGLLAGFCRPRFSGSGHVCRTVVPKSQFRAGRPVGPWGQDPAWSNDRGTATGEQSCNLNFPFQRAGALAESLFNGNLRDDGQRSKMNDRVIRVLQNGWMPWLYAVFSGNGLRRLDGKGLPLLAPV
jgi:hypothetical protein